MSLFENPENLQLLRDLLNPQKQADDGSDLEDTEESLMQHQAKANPGALGPAKNNSCKKSLKTVAKSPYAPLDATSSQRLQPKSLEEWQAQHEQDDADILDSRKTPSYSLTYRQAVRPEDVFLQMGNRTNASASCEDLVVDIFLPDDDTPSDKMQLNITESQLHLSTATYHLKLPLVHQVNVDRCHAKYQPEEHKLTLTLRLQREFDFVNF